MAPDPRRDFRLLLAGQTTAQLGTQLGGVAVPLLAVLALGASPLQLGLVSAAGTVPFLLIGLPAGAWVDRRRRRPLLVAADVSRAALLLSVPAAAALGLLTLVQLVVVALLAGVARVVFDVAYQSYLPVVTGGDRLLSANAAMETVRAGGQVVGPGVGGWLAGLAGAADVLLVQAATFAVSAATLLAIRAGEPQPPAPPRRPRDGVAARDPARDDRLRTRIAEGLRVVVGTPVLRATALTSAAGNLAFAIASAVTVVFMVRTLRLPAGGVGVVTAVGAVSVMAGAALTPWLARRVGSARIVWLSLAATAPFNLLVPLARPGRGVVLLLVGMAAGELGQIVYAVTNVSLRQRLCPPHLLGRVTATMRFIIMGLFPLGAVAGGLLGEVVGVRAALAASGGLIVASTVPVWRALRGARDVEEVPAVLSGPAHPPAGGPEPRG